MTRWLLKHWDPVFACLFAYCASCEGIGYAKTGNRLFAAFGAFALGFFVIAAWRSVAEWRRRRP